MQNETRILATECRKDSGKYRQDAGTETGVRDSERDKEVFEMKIWFTLTGTCHYFGQDFLEKGMKIRLEKEPDNKYDREAIKVLMKGLGHIGYVANSTHTMIGESYSAGRLYDKIGDKAKGRVFMVMDKGVLCWLETEKNPVQEKAAEEE